MCGRYASQLPPEAIARLFATIGALPNVAPSWNVCPRQRAMVVRRNPESGERRLDLLTWGLVPHFTTDLAACTRPINARAETVYGMPTFRAAFAQRRCLVPADLFYEWRAEPGGRQPFAIARTDGAPLALGGIWTAWSAPGDEVLRTFAIVTTAANPDVVELHNRMPLVLEPADWPLWLGEREGDPRELLRPAPAGTLRLWPVSRAVNSARNNGPELATPVADGTALGGGGPNPA